MNPDLANNDPKQKNRSSSYDFWETRNKKVEYIPLSDHAITSMNCVTNFLDQLLSKKPVGIAELSNLLDFLVIAITRQDHPITKHLLHKTGQIIVNYYHKDAVF